MTNTTKSAPKLAPAVRDSKTGRFLPRRPIKPTPAMEISTRRATNGRDFVVLCNGWPLTHITFDGGYRTSRGEFGTYAEAMSSVVPR